MLIDLHGRLERITYTNEESGFTVAKVAVDGYRELVTVVADLVAPTLGEILKMKGTWVHHPKYGKQFKVIQHETAVPATIEGIRKYLGSGLIRGIGPEIAGRIIEKFGEKSLEIIEEAPEKLAEIRGIGKKRIATIIEAWEQQREIRNVMLFLHAHAVSSAYAMKIFKQYGHRSISVVKSNPYRLATDIFGIGFLTADRIAEKLGFTKESPARVAAGILYVLNGLAEEGHLFYPYHPLIENCKETLQVDRDIVIRAVGDLAMEKRIVIDDLSHRLDPSDASNQSVYPAVYLTQYHVCETGIASKLKSLCACSKSIRIIDANRAVDWVQRQLDIRLAEKQKEAIQHAVESKVMVITGGPGTGKTTIIQAIVKIFSRVTKNIDLASPTGRSAKRMSEATKREAKTIHRLLEYNFQKGGFQKNEEKPLKCDLLIIDEASMVDAVIMHHLLKALPSYTTLLLVGDVNQLPSVGPGNVLGDIIASGFVPTIKLDEIFRQAKESRIIVNAHCINKGLVPSFKTGRGRGDCFFIEEENPEKVLQLIVELTKERIPVYFGFDSIEDIQVLTPMHRGLVGASNLNQVLQKALNPGEQCLSRGGAFFKPGDKVMQIINNYDKEVFNGDIGRVLRIDTDDHRLVVVFDGRQVVYDFMELDDLVLAYAISVHKSQGSEYPAVVIPILTQHYTMLQRNLIYTAVTRGRRLVVMVGMKKALAIAVKNDKPQNRHTHLRNRLME